MVEVRPPPIIFRPESWIRTVNFSGIQSIPAFEGEIKDASAGSSVLGGPEQSVWNSERMFRRRGSSVFIYIQAPAHQGTGASAHQHTNMPELRSYLHFLGEGSGTIRFINLTYRGGGTTRNTRGRCVSAV